MKGCKGYQRTRVDVAQVFSDKSWLCQRVCHFLLDYFGMQYQLGVPMLGMLHSSFLHRHAFSSLNPERTTLENWMHSTTGSPNTSTRSTKELDLSQSKSSNDLNFKRWPTNIVPKLEGLVTPTKMSRRFLLMIPEKCPTCYFVSFREVLSFTPDRKREVCGSKRGKVDYDLMGSNYTSWITASDQVFNLQRSRRVNRLFKMSQITSLERDAPN